MSEGKVSANGITIWYQTFGDSSAPALLLVSGLGSQAIGWDDALCTALAEAGRFVIRFDNRDVGLSQWFDEAQEAYSLDDMADDAAGLLSALEIERAHVVGASMGGMIAQLVAIRHPEKVVTLTSIMSTTGDAGVGPPQAAAVLVLMAEPGKTHEERVRQSIDGAKVLAGPRFPVDEERLRRRAEQALQRAWHPSGTMRQIQAIMTAPPRVEPLEQISVPTLVIHGTADPLVPYAGGESTARAIPGAKLLTIEGMGHEIPPGSWDEIIPAILDHTS